VKKSSHQHVPTKSCNLVLGSLSNKDLCAIEPAFEQVALEPGMILQERGRLVEYVYFPVGGLVSLISNMSDGASIEIATVGREAAVGATPAMHDRVVITQAVVQIATTAFRIKADVFRKLVDQNDGFKQLIFRHNYLQFAQVQQTAACNAVHSAEARLAKWLLQTSDRTNDSRLAMTQERLSQIIGVHRPTLTNVVKGLQEAGSIANRRGAIEILDRKALEQKVCECYGIIRDLFEKTFAAKS